MKHMYKYLIPLAAVFIYMNLWFLISLIRKRNDVADEAWGLGFIFLSLVSLITFSNYTLKVLIVLILISLWGFRLFWHINKRHRNKPEDQRYQNWRNEWKNNFYLRSYLQVFMLQGFLIYIIFIPIMFIIKGSSGAGLNFFEFAGLVVWFFGFLFEAISDWQLSKFIKNKENPGKLIQTGLWKYSRHPNYFGEVVLWWGFWIMSIPSGLYFISLLGPLTISFLILKVSGVPLLEKNMSKKPGFEDYKKRTSVFIPLSPRN